MLSLRNHAQGLLGGVAALFADAGKRAAKRRENAENVSFWGRLATRLGELPYWQQGDEEMNTTDALTKRHELRDDPGVVAALELWWQTTKRSMETEDPGKQHSEDQSLDHDQYVLMSKKIYKAMIEDFDEAEALKEAEADWNKDSCGLDRMGKATFLDAIFELAVRAVPTVQCPLDLDRCPDRTCFGLRFL